MELIRALDPVSPIARQATLPLAPAIPDRNGPTIRRCPKRKSRPTRGGRDWPGLVGGTGIRTYFFVLESSRRGGSVRLEESLLDFSPAAPRLVKSTTGDPNVP